MTAAEMRRRIAELEAKLDRKGQELHRVQASERQYRMELEAEIARLRPLAEIGEAAVSCVEQCDWVDWPLTLKEMIEDYREEQNDA